MATAALETNEKLSSLLQQVELLEQRIRLEKRKLRDRSKERQRIRERAIGHVIEGLAREGRFSQPIMDIIKHALLAHVDGNNAKFESFEGTVFDLSDLLREFSDPAE